MVGIGLDWAGHSPTKILHFVQNDNGGKRDMSKEVIIDPEWEKEEDAREMPRSRPRRVDSFDPDPFGVERVEAVAEHDPDSDPPFDPDEQFEDRKPAAKARREPLRAAQPEPEPQPEEPDSFAEPEERLVSRTKQYIGMLLSGSILTRAEVRRAYPYMILVAFLMLLYISSVFRMQQLHRREAELQREVKALRAKALETSSRRMSYTRQSHIIEQLRERGIVLEEALTPPKIIDK